MNAMMYVRGNRLDFERWAETFDGDEGDGWRYENVLDYFKKSENNLQTSELGRKYHAEGGKLPVSKYNYTFSIEKDILTAAKELGLNINDDVNGASHEGFGTTQATPTTVSGTVPLGRSSDRLPEGRICILRSRRRRRECVGQHLARGRCGSSATRRYCEGA